MTWAAGIDLDSINAILNRMIFMTKETYLGFHIVSGLENIVSVYYRLWGMTNSRREDNNIKNRPYSVYIYIFKSISEWMWDVESSWLTHTARQFLFLYTPKLVSVCFHICCFSKTTWTPTTPRDTRAGRTSRRRAHQRPLALNRWPFCFFFLIPHVLQKTAGPTWRPWMFLGCGAGSPGDIQPPPRRRRLGSRLCLLQGPAVSGVAQTGGDNN